MAYTTNTKVEKVRLEAIRMLKAGKSTREVARYFGYAQSTIVKWNKRKNEAWHNKSGIPTKSSRPHTSPRRTPRNIEAMVLGVRQETKRCAEVVYATLTQRGVSISLSSLKRILSRYGMLKKRSPWKKKRVHPLRPDIAKQGDLVQFDTVHFVDKNGKKTYIYTAIDVYSRYAYARWYTKANTHSTLNFLKHAQEYFPFEILCIQTDNGPEFGRWFSDHCKIQHRHNHPRSPNENGHLERFNRTLQEEPEKHGLSIFNGKDIQKYLQHYNTQRMHMGIDFKTPAQMLNK